MTLAQPLSLIVVLSIVIAGCADQPKQASYQKVDTIKIKPIDSAQKTSSDDSVQYFEDWTHNLKPADSFYTIKRAFAEWGLKAIKLGKFAASDTCNPTYVNKHEENFRRDTLVYGIDVPENINFLYSDLNKDGKIDALITFVPLQCDGGNGGQWQECEVLVLSDEKGYVVNDSFFKRYKRYFEGRAELDSLDNMGRIYGWCGRYDKDDGYCCPMSSQKFYIDWKTKAIHFDKKIRYKVE